MTWNKVGNWLKDNAGTGAALVGSLLTGNAPGAIAAGVSLVSSAAGSTDPSKALQSLQQDPATVIRLQELANQEEASIRAHIAEMTRIEFEGHQETQETIRSGDNANDEYVRRTRPQMAKQSWVSTIAYCVGCFGVRAVNGADLFDIYIAGILSAPAWAYIGLRTIDGFAPYSKSSRDKKRGS